MRLALASLFLVGQLAVGAAQPDRSTSRDAVIGCWDAGGGATLTLIRDGKRGVRATVTFAETPRGGPRRISELAVWVQATKELEVPCRPLSQHGSFCRVSPATDGLRVRVFAKGHGTGARGRLVEDLVAARCAKR